MTSPRPAPSRSAGAMGVLCRRLPSEDTRPATRAAGTLSGTAAAAGACGAARATAAEDARPRMVAQARRQLAEHVAENPDFVGAARAASGEHQRQRRIIHQKRKSRPPFRRKSELEKVVGPVPPPSGTSASASMYTL